MSVSKKNYTGFVRQAKSNRLTYITMVLDLFQFGAWSPKGLAVVESTVKKILYFSNISQLRHDA